jgi:hypothetical protein
MSPEAFNAWARTWPDEAVPELEDVTPRPAARDARGRIPVEAHLRDLEHQVVANGARGLRNVDVAELRSVLGMSANRPT